MKKSDALNLVFLILCVGIAVAFGIPGLIPFADEELASLVRETVPRLAVGVFLIVLMARGGYARVLKSRWKASHLLWSIPCLLVAIANFPFSALINGSAVIERLDLLWIFLLKCVAIALFEEMFFRGLLLSFVEERLREGRYRAFWTVLITSASFALMHLINLFFGAGLGETALQIGYTFLIGCMLAVTVIKTRNIWLCVLIHALFDVGGTIVTDLGSGAFQDVTFWVLTAVCGLICAVHIAYALWKTTKNRA